MFMLLCSLCKDASPGLAAVVILLVARLHAMHERESAQRISCHREHVVTGKGVKLHYPYSPLIRRGG